MVGSLVLNRFLIERRIGSGGFGTVYEAWDGRLERPVAVKAIESAESRGSGRVLREAQAAARLNHPGIVTLYEMGEEDGNALLVTELVDGSTLAQLNREGALSDREVGEIAADLCEALDHAHCRAVVHRDIKPQNVLVTEDGEPRAKLMDFGVARLVDGAALTAPGDVVGTLAYMAPEQAEGREAGPEADVYSLALMLYECWSGENPNRRTTPAATPARSALATGRCAGCALTCPASCRTPSTPAWKLALAGGHRSKSWEARSRPRSTAWPRIHPGASVRCTFASPRSPSLRFWEPGSPPVTASCSRRIRAGFRNPGTRPRA